MFQKVENSGIISLTSMVEIASVKVSGGFLNSHVVLQINFRKKNPAEAGFFKVISYETNLVGARRIAYCDICAETAVTVIICTAVEALNARSRIIIFNRNSPEPCNWQTSKAMSFNGLT